MSFADLRGIPRLEARDLYEAVDIVAQTHGFTVHDIVHGGRQSALVAARREAVLVLDEMGLPSIEIGRLLDRDHTTVLHHLGRLSRRNNAAREG